MLRGPKIPNSWILGETIMLSSPGCHDPAGRLEDLFVSRARAMHEGTIYPAYERSARGRSRPPPTSPKIQNSWILGETIMLSRRVAHSTRGEVGGRIRIKGTGNARKGSDTRPAALDTESLLLLYLFRGGPHPTLPILKVKNGEGAACGSLAHRPGVLP